MTTSQFRKLSLDCNPISWNAFFLQVMRLYNGCLLWKKNVVEIRQYQNDLKCLACFWRRWIVVYPLSPHLEWSKCQSCWGSGLMFLSQFWFYSFLFLLIGQSNIGLPKYFCEFFSSWCPNIFTQLSREPLNWSETETFSSFSMLRDWQLFWQRHRQ